MFTFPLNELKKDAKGKRCTWGGDIIPSTYTNTRLILRHQRSTFVNEAEIKWFYEWLCGLYELSLLTGHFSFSVAEHQKRITAPLHKHLHFPSLLVRAKLASLQCNQLKEMSMRSVFNQEPIKLV